MNNLSAPDLWRNGNNLEKKAWLPLALTVFGFFNMFWQIPHLQFPWRYLLLLSWLFPLIVSLYISSTAAAMKREANRNWGSDEEGTEF